MCAADADPAGLGSALHAEAARLGRRRSPATTSSSWWPATCLDISSIVEPDAQIAVVARVPRPPRRRRRRSIACSGNHDLNAANEHDERAAPWLERGACGGVFVDGSRLELRRRADHGVRVVGRPAHARRRRPAARRRRGARRRSTLDLGVPRTARRLADELDRQAALRRRGPRRVDRAVPARRSCSAGTCTSRRSCPTAGGSTASVRRPCSTAVARPARCRPTSSSTPRQASRGGRRTKASTSGRSLASRAGV